MKKLKTCYWIMAIEESILRIKMKITQVFQNLKVHSKITTLYPTPIKILSKNIHRLINRIPESVYS